MSRKLEDLLPTVEAAARRALANIDKDGVDYLVTCTYRTREEQADLYAQGRTKPGRKVTNAKPGQSLHQYRVALDIYPAVNGKIDFAGSQTKAWQTIAKHFIAEGFEWAYNWKRFREMPHFQMTKGNSLAYFQNGGKI